MDTARNQGYDIGKKASGIKRHIMLETGAIKCRLIFSKNLRLN